MASKGWGGSRLADRVAREGQTRFIGRRAELNLFASALAAGRSTFTVLHVHGPGGVGKSTLLREMARLARAADRPVVELDGRNVPASRRAVLRALAEASGGAPAGRSVLLVDTYERWSALDAWR